MNLVDLAIHNPKIVRDIRYATDNNFVGFAVYDRPACYVHEAAAKSLDQVQAELEKMGLGLKVYDGYRIPSAIQIFWDTIKDERYVSNPSKSPGRHSKGTAVDVTIIDGEGKELEMPTEFDAFTEEAHSDAENISEEAKKNRALLTRVMGAAGFIQLPTEWWHFDLKGWEEYPRITASFDEIESLLRV